MKRFSATNKSEAVVSAPRAEVWAALTDPVLLPKLTPLLERVDADGDTWTWHMLQIKGLGVGISPKFTEKMSFDETDGGSRIDYNHAPPDGVHERTGAEGHYVLTDASTDEQVATRLSIELTLTVELPLPKSAGPAVRGVIASTMNRTGERFSKNLLDHLGAHELQPAGR